jgi:hypothetical protein
MGPYKEVFGRLLVDDQKLPHGPRYITKKINDLIRLLKFSE